MCIEFIEYKEYKKHCWRCKMPIPLNQSTKCRLCSWYICPVCGACAEHCSHYDSEGYDRFNFNSKQIHRNGTKYDNAGFDANGRNKDGYDRFGFDVNGRDRDGYDRDGFDVNEKDRDGYDRFGFNANGQDRDGYDRNGFNMHGYNREGYDKKGFDKNGYDCNGFDVHGYNREGYSKKGFDKKGVHKNGSLFDGNGFNVDGVDVVLLQCKKYTVGTKVVHNGLLGEIVKYEPEKSQPIIKIRYENNEVKMYSLRTLIINGSIKRVQI